MRFSNLFSFLVVASFAALSGATYGAVVNLYTEEFESGTPGTDVAGYEIFYGAGHYQYSATTIDSGQSAEVTGGTDAFARYDFPSPYIIGSTHGAGEVLRTSVVINTTGSAAVMFNNQNGFFNFGSSIGVYILGEFQGSFPSPVVSGETTDMMWETDGSNFFDVFTRPHGTSTWNLLTSISGVPMPDRALGIRLGHEGASAFQLDTIKLDADTVRTIPEPSAGILFGVAGLALVGLKFRRR